MFKINVIYQEKPWHKHMSSSMTSSCKTSYAFFIYKIGLLQNFCVRDMIKIEV